MKRCRKGHKSPGWKAGVACILMAAQTGASLWSSAMAQTAHEALVNDSLPLPELNLNQLENAIKSFRARKSQTQRPQASATATANARPATISPQPHIATRVTLPTMMAPTSTNVSVPAAYPVSTWKGSDAGSPGLTNDSMWLEDALPLRAPITESTNKSAKKQLTSLEPRIAEASNNQVSPIGQPASDVPTIVTRTANGSQVIAPAPATIAPNMVQPPVQLNTFAVKTKSTVALSTPATPVQRVNAAANQPIFIDNDEQTELQTSIEYEKLPTDPTGEKVKVGARFPIVITSEINSKTAKIGDPIQGRLKYDLKIGTRMIAVKGSPVRGHINYVLKARTPMHSLVSPERWYKDSGCLGLSFDEIVNKKGEHIPLEAEPARQSLVIKNKGEGRELGINNKGQVTGLWSTQLKYKAVRIGLNAALSPAGVFSFGAMPIALGVLGAANPSFAFMKPVGTNVRHRRIKGFFWGALSGVPGSWLIEDTTIKGQEAVIKPGDEFYACMRKEFTGEPAPAGVAADADMNVKGQIVGRHGGKKKLKQ